VDGSIVQLSSARELDALTVSARKAAQEVSIAMDLDDVDVRRESVRAYGEALLAIRRKISANIAYHDHIKKNGLEVKDTAFRSNSIWLAENWSVLVTLLKRCPYAHPTHIREWFRRRERDPAKAEFDPIIKPTDNWNFSPVRYGRRDDEGHGYIPGDLYANCLWYWTKPHQIVAAPMAGVGQIKYVYDCRDEWAIPEPWDLDLRMFDLSPRGEYAHLIEQNDLTIGLPVYGSDYDYIIMDVPYFGMVGGQYSNKSSDLANMKIHQWSKAISAIARSCRDAQVGGGLSTVISPNFRQIKTREVILTTVIVREAFRAAGYVLRDLAYASRRVQQDQSPGMGRTNNMAKRNRTMMTDISEILTFERTGAAEYPLSPGGR
jgi:hypothetical protein